MHRSGEQLSPLEIMVMGVFGLLVVGGVVLAARQGAKQREQVARYSATRGYPLIEDRDARLAELLEEAGPDLTWRPRRVMLVRRSPPRAYLFGYEGGPKDRPSKSSRGTAVLAEHDGRRIESPVEIFTRTPGVEGLVGGRVEAGSLEFRRKFTVTSSSSRTATEVVTTDIERALMEHMEGPGWYLTVTISAGAVLVSSFWAESEEEWDHLVELGTRLQEAVR